jgi:hypothetical protein
VKICSAQRAELKKKQKKGKKREYHVHVRVLHSGELTWVLFPLDGLTPTPPGCGFCCVVVFILFGTGLSSGDGGALWWMEMALPYKTSYKNE